MTTAPESFSSAPQDAKAWDDVVAGGAEKIFDQYVRQLRHRRRIESATLALAFFGPILGFVVVISFLGTAAWLINRGYGIEGTFLGTVDIASLAAVFALGGASLIRPARDNAEPKPELEKKEAQQAA
jgi:hypothetical protein